VESATVEIQNSNRADVNLEIFDNASTGLSKEILNSMVLPMGSIIHTSQENLGYDANVKRAVELSQGRFVKILADDDILTPGSLLRHLDAIENEPNLAFIVSDFAKYSADLNRELEPPFLPNRFGGLHRGEEGLKLTQGRFGQVSALTFNQGLFAGTEMNAGLGTNYIHVFAVYELARKNPFHVVTGNNILVRDGSPNFSASMEKMISTPVQGLSAIQGLRTMGYSKTFVDREYRLQAKYIAGLIAFGKLNNVKGLASHVSQTFGILGARSYLFAAVLVLLVPSSVLRALRAVINKMHAFRGWNAT
jgi:glycosyltransferase involved in cell wall biosynthesis